MKISEKTIRVVSVVTVIIEVILAVCLLTNCYEHYMSNNIWVEEDDKFLSPLITIIVVVVLVVIPFTILNLVLKAKSRKPVRKKIDMTAIKKRCSTNMISHIVLTFLLYIISEKTVRSLIVDLLSLSLSEASYMAGHYGIFRSSFLIMLVVLIVSDIITICIANKLMLSANSGDSDDVLGVSEFKNNDIGRVDMKAEFEAKRKVIKKFWIIYAAVLIVVLLIVFYLIYRMTTPHINVNRFTGTW